MGLLTAILAVFIAAALAGCVLEVSTGSILFRNDAENTGVYIPPVDSGTEAPLPDTESPPVG